MLPPPVIPVGVPSDLLQRRPDIAAAERRVAAANAEIGVAKTAYYPTLTLSAAAGLEGSSITNWFAWPSHFFAVGPSLLETLYDAGRRHAYTDQAWAAYDANVASYRQNVLTAFQEVEDNLAGLRILEEESRQTESSRAVGRTLAGAFHEPLQGRTGDLPRGHHRAKRRPEQRARPPSIS